MRYRDRRVSLHRFWDTDVLRVAGLSEREIAESVAAIAEMLPAAGAGDPPSAWAAESLALRARVYAFPRAARGPSRLDDAYLAAADAITRVRLAQAAMRLAGVLNRALGC